MVAKTSAFTTCWYGAGQGRAEQGNVGQDTMAANSAVQHIMTVQAHIPEQYMQHSGKQDKQCEWKQANCPCQCSLSVAVELGTT